MHTELGFGEIGLSSEVEQKEGIAHTVLMAREFTK